MGKITFVVGGVNIEMEQEEVSKAIETGKLELSSEELITYKKDDFEVFKTNLSNDEYKKGKAAGVEMTVKDAREKHGLEFEGKSIDNLIDAIKTKTLTEAKVEPSKKIQELESDKAKLLANYQEIETQFSTFKNEVTGKETRTKKDNTLLSFIPKDSILVSQNIALLALKNDGIDADITDTGLFVPTINGQVKKNDKTLEPEGFETIIQERLKALGLIKEKQGGSGGSDEPGGGSAGSYESFVSRMEANNINEGSIAFSEKMQEEMKAGTLKI